MRIFFSSVILILFFVSCSAGGLKERQLLTQYFQKKDYKEVHKVLNESATYKEEKNKLLFLMEKAMVFHAQEQYLDSIETFLLASDLARQLYTVRISKKVAALLANDNYDVYYGEAYERSLIHMYQTLNYYLLAKKGEVLERVREDKKVEPARKLENREIAQFMSRARSEVLAWNALIETFQNERMGKSVFKNDLMAKLLGGFVHENTDTINDLQTAYLLYQDARDILVKNYGGYQSFNSSFKKFKGDFEKFPSLGIEQVRKNYISPTHYFDELNEYLEYKILSLSKKIRPHDYEKLVKIFAPKKTVLDRVERERHSPNLTILFHHSIIPPKVPDKYYFGLNPDNFQGGGQKVLAAVGQVALTHFMMNVLKLRHNSAQSVGSAYATVQMASVTSQYASFDFELPKIQNRPLVDNLCLVVKDERDHEVLKRKLVIVNPIGDIAEEAVAEKSAWRYTRTGTRLALKYAAVVASAYGAYKAAGGEQGTFSGIAAMASFLAGSRLIKASEIADTRYWSLLPEDLRMEDLYLPEGHFELFIIGDQNKYSLGKITISDPNAKHLISYRN
ncbi:MAG: hypothetical protein A2381_16110 [Bdellovibrionales bacterium RIFOXYB1_FULL_37_110]|nr:MAG: hypothetical protein A2417_07960 [Bdellovibrionales bacterium RIFOXYC1_FULL_37_79]OFZ57137.1 MAG: hypothetical protein A2381_16110 [Bdellovibrionales bacterium RIFOXYB1_FULL_37_110]OFZ65379.1 MAG: hypothetical protein A2577_03760 [Bdellovibrionales bacterium RIFOXYD1_FULL_36_51]